MGADRTTGNNNSIHEMTHGGENAMAVTEADAPGPVSDRSAAGGGSGSNGFYCRRLEISGKSLTARYR
jgi:hypothetical protein